MKEDKNNNKPLTGTDLTRIDAEKEIKVNQVADLTRGVDSDQRESALGHHLRPTSDGQARVSAITWQAPEFEYIHKDISWYWLSLIVAIVIIGVSLWQKNFLFAIFAVLAWFVIVNIANKFPSIWEFAIDEKGVNIRKPNKPDSARFYVWDHLAGFDIHEGGEEYMELVLKSRSRLSTYLKVPIYRSDEDKIREFLLRYIIEEEYEVSLAESISDAIGF